MKHFGFYILALLVLFSCQEDEDTTPFNERVLYQPPQLVESNLAEGYSVNPVTGDTIEPTLNNFGEEIISGQLVPIEGFKVLRDTLDNPAASSAPIPELFRPILIKGVIPDIGPIRTEMNEDILDIPNYISDVDQHSYTTRRDTIIFNESFDLIPEIVPCRFPHYQDALEPRMKDNSIHDIRYLDIEQGLSSSYLSMVFEDSRGNKWIGADKGGVNFYDGTRFLNFRPDNGLIGENIYYIEEDRSGAMWFGSYNGGLSRFDGTQFENFGLEQGISEMFISDLLIDSKGDVWVGYYNNGLSRIEINSDGTYTCTNWGMKEGLLGNRIRDIYEDREHNIWICSYGDGINKFDGSNWTYYDAGNGLPTNWVNCVYQDKKMNLWLGMDDGLGLLVEPENGREGYFLSYTEEHGLKDNEVRIISSDSKDNLWLAMPDGGVAMFDGLAFSNYNLENGLSNDRVFHLAIDEYDNVWASTYGGGVSIIRNHSFKHYMKSSGLTDEVVRSFYEEDDGTILLGTDDGSLLIVNQDKTEIVSSTTGFVQGGVIRTIKEDSKGTFWMACDRAGLYSFSKRQITNIQSHPQVMRPECIDLDIDKQDRIWAASFGGGIFCYEQPNGEHSGIFTHFGETNGLPDNLVRSVLVADDGSIWLGTVEAGVVKLNLDKNGEVINYICYSEKEGLAANNIRDLSQDSKGNIWISSDGGGAIMFDGTSFCTYREGNGISNNVVRAAVEDSQGNIWLTSEKGLSRLWYRDGYEYPFISTYGLQDGLKSTDFYTSAAMIDSKDRLWLGSGKALSVMRTDKVSISRFTPEVRLLELEIQNHTFDFRNLPETNKVDLQFDCVSTFYNYPIGLELPYYTNHLHFTYSAIDWNAPHKIYYSYKLEGVDNRWTTPEQSTEADYRNLSPGDYTFKVRAIGGSQKWSEPFEYHFIIHPPWWQTIWAYVMYVIAFILIIFLSVGIRTRRLKRRQKILEHQVKDATSEIIKQKDEIEEAHSEIKDSIAYAQRIQNAILPAHDFIHAQLPESFVIYKPKDVVAGDFYWMQKLEAENILMFAVADCTGHGVPGAMVSVVCYNALNRTIREFRELEPGKTLDQVRIIVIEEFDKKRATPTAKKIDVIQDGMDIALCCLKDDQLFYSGAHRPLWIIRNGEIIEYSPDKQPIGKFEHQTPFTTNKVQLQKGDMAYMFSDGYPDQFGGERGKKFKMKQLRELLISVHHLGMEEQQLAIEKAFDDWKKGHEQIDDVCLMGIRF